MRRSPRDKLRKWLAKASKAIQSAKTDLKEIAKANKILAANEATKINLIASILIAITELTIPFTLNIVYMDAIPSGEAQQLTTVLIASTAILITGAWLKQVRYKLIANNTSRLEHANKIKSFNNILGGQKEDNKSNIQTQIETLGLLRNQEYTQIQTLTFDLAISVVFLLVLAQIALPLTLPSIISIYIFYNNSGIQGKIIEAKKEEEYSHKVNESIFTEEIAMAANAIKSNGLTMKFMATSELMTEERIRKKEEVLILEEKLRNGNLQASQLAYFLIAFIGSIGASVGYISMATMGTCLLIAGKITGPWQQLFALRVSIEKNKKAKQYASHLLTENNKINYLNTSRDEEIVKQIKILSYAQKINLESQ